MIRTFTPGTPTVKITAGAASANVAVNTNTRTVRVVNSASAPVFIEIGGAGVTASASTSMPVLAGATETFGKGANGFIAVICPAGAGDVFFTCGEGM